jgi:lactoylglutathione lyase
MTMTLRVEIFTDDLDALVDFYTRVLGFTVDRDERGESPGYVALSRDTVYVGAAERAAIAHLDGRRPPAGTELVLEVDDVRTELVAVQSSGWPIEEGLQERPWGLSDFRVLDPAGYYLRITDR